MFCFVRSVRDVPVSLVDGISGKVRCRINAREADGLIIVRSELHTVL